jgi:hypothetical protein
MHGRSWFRAAGAVVGSWCHACAGPRAQGPSNSNLRLGTSPPLQPAAAVDAAVLNACAPSCVVLSFDKPVFTPVATCLGCRCENCENQPDGPGMPPMEPLPPPMPRGRALDYGQAEVSQFCLQFCLQFFLPATPVHLHSSQLALLVPTLFVGTWPRQLEWHDAATPAALVSEPVSLWLQTVQAY